MNRTLQRFAACLALLCCAVGPCASSLEILPRGRLFRLTFADPREIRMALAFEGDARLQAAIGNYFSLLAVRPENDSGWLWHFGLEGAGYFVMRQAQSRFPLETADGLIGTYLETSSGPWQMQLRYTHISAHLADGSSDSPIPFSREFVALRAGYAPTPDIHVYAGASYLTNSIPPLDPLALQVGGAYFHAIPSLQLAPFLATHLQWRQESIINPSLQLQCGIALNNPPEAYRSFRFFYSYFTGVDPRGQYYTNAITTHSLGIEMQI